jgi:hypothetical protein
MKVSYENWRGSAAKTFEDATLGEIRSDRDGALEQCQDEIQRLASIVGRLIEHIAETDPRAESLVTTVLNGTLER